MPVIRQERGPDLINKLANLPDVQPAIIVGVSTGLTGVEIYMGINVSFEQEPI